MGHSIPLRTLVPLVILLLLAFSSPSWGTTSEVTDSSTSPEPSPNPTTKQPTLSTTKATNSSLPPEPEDEVKLHQFKGPGETYTANLTRNSKWIKVSVTSFSGYFPITFSMEIASFPNETAILLTTEKVRYPDL